MSQINKSRYLTDDRLVDIVADKILLDIIKKEQPIFYGNGHIVLLAQKVEEEILKLPYYASDLYWKDKIRFSEDKSMHEQATLCKKNIKLAAQVLAQYKAFTSHWLTGHNDMFVSDIQIAREDYSELSFEEYIEELCKIAHTEELSVRGNYTTKDGAVVAFLVKPNDTAEKWLERFKEIGNR